MREIFHKCYCAVYNMPTYPRGLCDCGACKNLREEFELDVWGEIGDGDYWKSNMGTLTEYIEWLERYIEENNNVIKKIIKEIKK